MIRFETIFPNDPPELRQKVFLLRYLVYVDELGLPLQNEEKLLYDIFDSYHPSILIFFHDEPIGTARVEIESFGPMEIYQDNETWKDLIRKKTGNCVSISRYVILKKFRKLNLTPKSIYYVYKQSGLVKRFQVENFFFAANNLKLVKLYTRSFGNKVSDEKHSYNFMGLKRDGYILMDRNIGRPGSFRRLKNDLAVEMMNLILPMLSNLKKYLN